jgi:hypothetical protein
VRPLLGGRERAKMIDKDGEVRDGSGGGAISFEGDRVTGIGVGDGTVGGDVGIVYSVSSGSGEVEKTMQGRC